MSFSLNVLLEHPVYGLKYAHHEKEVEADLANGWRRAGEVAEAAEPAPAKRRGRPPKAAVEAVVTEEPGDAA